MRGPRSGGQEVERAGKHPSSAPPCSERRPLTMKRLIALSLGTMAALVSQRTRFTCRWRKRAGGEGWRQGRASRARLAPQLATGAADRRRRRRRRCLV